MTRKSAWFSRAAAHPQAFEQPRTREEVLHKMEERTGLAGRKMLEKFLVRLDKLERGRNSR
jgi:hypothetical protein